MNTVIKRIYTTTEGKRECFLQGKIFRPRGYSFDIYYRDVYPQRSTLYKTRYARPESESYNLDHLVWEFLRKSEVKEIHYYLFTKAKLMAVEVERVERHIKLGNVTEEKLNNHTQLFIPKRLFTEKRRDYTVPWITQETNINDLLKEKEEERGAFIPYEVKLKLVAMMKSKVSVAQQPLL